MQDISLSQIIISPQQRCLAEAAHIQRYLLFYAHRGVLPPLQLNQQYHLLSGVEVFLAAERLGLSQVRAVIEPRTQDQKEQDVLNLLFDPRWCQENSKALARYTHIQRKMVVKLRAHYGDPTAERMVQRGGKTFMLTPNTPYCNVPVCLYDKPFMSQSAESADVILTVPPRDISISDVAARLSGILKASGTMYLLFTPDQIDDLCTWRHKLEKCGLPFGALLCWKVKDCASTLPSFELILVMGYIPPELRGSQVITGPRTRLAQDTSTLYCKPAWLSARLLKAHRRETMLDPFVRTSFTLRGAQRARVKNASGYLLSSEYREEAAPFVPQK